MQRDGCPSAGTTKQHSSRHHTQPRLARAVCRSRLAPLPSLTHGGSTPRSHCSSHSSPSLATRYAQALLSNLARSPMAVAEWAAWGQSEGRVAAANRPLGTPRRVSQAVHERLQRCSCNHPRRDHSPSSPGRREAGSQGRRRDQELCEQPMELPPPGQTFQRDFRPPGKQIRPPSDTIKLLQARFGSTVPPACAAACIAAARRHSGLPSHRPPCPLPPQQAVEHRARLPAGGHHRGAAAHRRRLHFAARGRRRLRPLGRRRHGGGHRTRAAAQLRVSVGV